MGPAPPACRARPPRSRQQRPSPPGPGASGPSGGLALPPAAAAAHRAAWGTLLLPGGAAGYEALVRHLGEPAAYYEMSRPWNIAPSLILVRMCWDRGW